MHSLGGEAGDAPRHPVDHENPPRGVDSDVGRILERTAPSFGTIPRRKEPPRPVEDLQPLVATVGDIDEARAVDGDPRRGRQLPRFRSGFPPFPHVRAIRAKDLNAAIERVQHVDVAVRTERQISPEVAFRAEYELAGTGA